jgi:hypothetical protein
MRRSLSGLISISIVVDHRIDPDEAKLVCRRALASNGEMRTSRCTPASVFSQP